MHYTVHDQSVYARIFIFLLYADERHLQFFRALYGYKHAYKAGGEKFSPVLYKRF